MPTDSHSRRAEVEALQAVWDLGDELDSNHARWAALRVAERLGVNIDAHNRFSEPPRNRNVDQLAALQAELDECRAATPSPDAGIDIERQRWAEWISEMGTALDAHDQGDWACAECRPTSDMLVPGFRCVVHEARAYLAGAPAGDAK